MPDYGFIANPQQTNPINTLGNILDLKGKQQALESGEIDLQAKRQANLERVALQNFMQNPDNFQTDGMIDIAKINATIPKIAPQTGGATLEKLTTLGNAQTNAEKAKVDLTQTERGYLGAVTGAMAGAGVDDPAKITQALDAVGKQFKDSPSMQSLVGNYKILLGSIPPGPHVVKALTNLRDQMLPPAQQQEAFTPKAGLTPTGGEVKETITTPSVGGNPPSISMTGRAEPMTLPPTATTVPPGGTQPMYVGKPPGGGATPAGAPFGAEASATGQNLSSIEHYKGVQAEAGKAAQNIGVLQEIKKYVPGAVAGAIADKRQLATGLASLIPGMDAATLMKTDTDLLAKNSAMLALAGGNTDAARGLAEAMNPNTKMSKDAIIKAANQVIGQQQLTIEKQNYLQSHVGNGEQYNKKLANFSSLADPRILQLPSLSTTEKKEMLDAMSPAERSTFIEKVRKMQQEGILK